MGRASSRFSRCRRCARLPGCDAPRNSAEYLHLLAEALRLAFADAAAGAIADPAVDGGAAATLLDDAYARARAR